ncbi:MAG: hypothetical protein KJ607_09255 [Bacteroidetes bacterium]|nr:hypothetical protein [Bacteroidota bacterium]
MKTVDAIKLKLAEVSLKRKLKGKNRIRIVHNLYSAKNVGIIFNASQSSAYDITRSFYTSLTQRGIKTEVLGFVDMKEILDYYTARKGYSFFCRKNLNWLGKPKNPVVDEFIGKKFDILIDLSLENSFPTRYIVSLTDASLKVGRYINKDSPYDFMIDISKNPSIEYLIEQVKYYLTVINN